jgi:hypothetical protein
MRDGPLEMDNWPIIHFSQKFNKPTKAAGRSNGLWRFKVGVAVGCVLARTRKGWEISWGSDAARVRASTHPTILARLDHEKLLRPLK